MANLSVSDGFRSSCPDRLEDGVPVLQKSSDPLQAVGNFRGDRVQVKTATLLEVSELSDLLAIQHDLPTDSPGPQRWRFPVVFFKLEVVLMQIDADCGQGFQEDLLHVDRRGF